MGCCIIKADVPQSFFGCLLCFLVGFLAVSFVLTILSSITLNYLKRCKWVKEMAYQLDWRIYCIQMHKITLESHFLYLFASVQVVCGYPTVLKMSWKKDSASVGLAGLTPHEAAKGALLCEEFQNIPDPLDIKKEDLFLLFTMSIQSKQVYLCCVCCVS